MSKVNSAITKTIRDKEQVRNFELASGPMYDWLEVKRANDHLCSLAMTYGFID